MHVNLLHVKRKRNENQQINMSEKPENTEQKCVEEHKGSNMN